MKKVLLMMALLSLPLSAAAEISGSIGAVSNYVWRGATQSDRSPAIQASITASVNGLYATAWASQVDFGDDTSAEVDYQVGYKFGGSTGIDVGVLAYTYVGDEVELQDDVKEAYISAFTGPFFVTAYREVLVEDDESASNFFEGGVDVSKYLPVDASILAIMDDDNEVGYGASLGKTWDNGFQVQYTYHSIDEAEHSFGLFYNF